MANVQNDIEWIINACRRGDSVTVERWLSAGGNPNQYDAQGWTPLLVACARGNADQVRMLLDASTPANPDIPFLQSGALPIHLAGQAGSIAVADLLLNVWPEHLDRVWLLNGHTLLLQAAFYGHADLALWALKRGANAAATTVRGLAVLELATQFENNALVDVIRPYNPPAVAKDNYLQVLLGLIAPFVPFNKREQQEHLDRLAAAISSALRPKSDVKVDADAILTSIRIGLDDSDINVNNLCGPLQQPLLVVAVTGSDGHPPRPDIATLRYDIACELLDRGSDPTRREQHPMGVDAIIRAAVFGHLDILKSIAKRIGADRMAAALNNQPAVNGLTALHDTVLRASTAGPENLERYLAQIRWATDAGALSNIEDYSGRTQADIARGTPEPERRRRMLDALGLNG